MAAFLGKPDSTLNGILQPIDRKPSAPPARTQANVQVVGLVVIFVDAGVTREEGNGVYRRSKIPGSDVSREGRGGVVRGKFFLHPGMEGRREVRQVISRGKTDLNAIRP